MVSKGKNVEEETELITDGKNEPHFIKKFLKNSKKKAKKGNKEDFNWGPPDSSLIKINTTAGTPIHKVFKAQKPTKIKVLQKIKTKRNKKILLSKNL